MSLPQTGSLGLWLQASDAATRFQSILGISAAVADGDPVGKLLDKSGAGFDLAATGNDSTRPTFKLVSGVPLIRFDGVNDILGRLAALDLYTTAGFTAMFVFKMSAPAGAAKMFAMRNNAAGGADANDLMGLFGSATSGANNQQQWRDHAGGNTQTSITGPNALNGTNRVLMLVCDPVAGTLKSYLDNVLTNTGPLDLASHAASFNTTGIGGFFRTAAGGGSNQFAAFDFYGAAFWPYAVFGTTDLTAAYNEGATWYVAPPSVINADGAVGFDALATAGAGRLLISATGTPTLGALGVAGAAVLPIMAAGDVGFDPIVMQGAGATAVKAIGDTTLGPLIVSSAARLPVQAAGATTLDALAVSGRIASSNISADGAVVFEEMQTSGAATLRVQAEGSIAFDPIVMQGAAAAIIEGDGAAVIDELLVTAFAALPLRAAGDVGFGPVVVHGAAASSLQVVADGATTFADLQTTGSARLPVRATGAVVIGELIMQGVGAAQVEANGPVEIGSLVVSGSGSVIVHGAGASTFGAVDVQGEGRVVVRAAAAFSFGPITVAAHMAVNDNAPLPDVVPINVLGFNRRFDAAVLARQFDVRPFDRTFDVPRRITR